MTRAVAPWARGGSLAVLLLLAGGVVPVGAAPDAPTFALPIACDPGRDCWITKHVDVDPGPGDQDHTCGRLTQNDHKGTDIGVRDMTVARAGVAVLAAADGIVFATRDGMRDINVARLSEPDREALSTTACGNAVVLDHGAGWRTIYCHMARGSVAVAKGDRVRAGDRLGLVGMSGLAEHPHLHFGVLKDGAVVDPFLGPAPVDGCGPATDPLWTSAAHAALPYRPLVINNLGIADHPPERNDSRDGLLADRWLPDTAPALVAWADVFGLEPGDTLDLRLVGPDGQDLAVHRQTMEQETLQYFAFTGRRLTADRGRWTPGPYTLSVTLDRVRAGAAPVRTSERVTVEVRPSP
ncbi:M23 family metallopeptidase [Roseospira visakhapatnamensis]|uniref:M23ase beta-sheet core domain-containing protein n=1 Tax=Roseospira visakhapatnamensis TaxID=390880 RepID=A0A7W6RC14_9PROT|nr:M23 family metallopeptidase [Roseospira visakhapatnamensis]MBB4265749.1 hypothetical protein [Roseospira visakhapatnamensis]